MIGVGTPSGQTVQAGELHPDVLKFQGVANLSVTDQHFDPLLWWKENKPIYRSLYKVAVMILGLAVTSARNERTFSVAGHVLNDLSSQLEPKMLSMLIFIRRNWHILLEDTVLVHETKDASGARMCVSEIEKEVNNLTVIVDRNRLSVTDFIENDKDELIKNNSDSNIS